MWHLFSVLVFSLLSMTVAFFMVVLVHGCSRTCSRALLGMPALHRLGQGAGIQEPHSVTGEENMWWEAGLGLEPSWESQPEARRGGSGKPLFLDVQKASLRGLGIWNIAGRGGSRCEVLEPARGSPKELSRLQQPGEQAHQGKSIGVELLWGRWRLGRVPDFSVCVCDLCAWYLGDQ